jgi:hypothetical protein
LSENERQIADMKKTYEEKLKQAQAEAEAAAAMVIFLSLAFFPSVFISLEHVLTLKNAFMKEINTMKITGRVIYGLL